MNNLRLILDTNILISAALLKQSVPRLVFDKALQIGEILLSNSTLEELTNVLKRNKFKKYITDAERILFVEVLLSQSFLIKTHEQINICRDPKDNKFLELAIAGKANYIISGDQDLLVLHPFGKTIIISPRDFLELKI